MVTVSMSDLLTDYKERVRIKNKVTEQAMKGMEEIKYKIEQEVNSLDSRYNLMLEEMEEGKFGKNRLMFSLTINEADINDLYELGAALDCTSMKLKGGIIYMEWRF